MTDVPYASSAIDDVRGATRLATDLTLLMTDVVETMHHNVASGRGPLGEAVVAPAAGLTGFVYRRIRGVTRLVGTMLDAMAAALAPLAPDVQWQGRDTLLGALNGVLGDHLEATDNPLQIRMQLRSHGRVLDVGDGDVGDGETITADARPRVVVMVHGLCMTDARWKRGAHDHGERLARDLDAELICLRYNSGRHISTNGAQFAQLLDAMVRRWPVRPEITLVGHSMGGLVIRSACASGKASRHAWVRHLKALVFLGTPHHGAPLERKGHGVDRLLAASPYTVAFTRLSRLRSAGITDLRHGSMLAQDWQGRDRFAHDGYACQRVPLPQHVAAFTIAGSLGKRSTSSRRTPPGDGLVPVASALGQNADSVRDVGLSPARSFVAYETGHLDLLASAAVYAQIHRWLAPRREAR